MKRTRVPGNLTEPFCKLELEYRPDKISDHVEVLTHVEDRRRVEIGPRPLNRGLDAADGLLQLPELFVPLLMGKISSENFPTPKIVNQMKREC